MTMQNSLFNIILVPIDFYDTSLNALSTAIAIAKRQKSRLILFHLFSKTLDAVYQEGIMGVDFTYHDVRDANKEKIRLLAEEITKKHRVKCQVFFVSGPVCPMIVEKARQTHSNLIVIGLLEIDSSHTFASLTKEASKLIKVLEDDQVKIDPQFYYYDLFVQKILDKAQALKVDLIVITATLDYKIQDFFVGPFARQVVNHAQIPVLSIRPAP
jgi:nucleotide-binding universal stress UspA family protein